MIQLSSRFGICRCFASLLHKLSNLCIALTHHTLSLQLLIDAAVTLQHASFLGCTHIATHAKLVTAFGLKAVQDVDLKDDKYAVQFAATCLCCHSDLFV